MHLTQGLHRAAQLKPDAAATIFGERRRTWREVRERVSRLAAGLVSLGLKSGDRVAPIALNSDRYVELYFAVWWAGGVIVPGNTRWALAEHIYALRDSGATILLVDKAFATLTEPIVRACEIQAAIYIGRWPGPGRHDQPRRPDRQRRADGRRLRPRRRSGRALLHRRHHRALQGRDAVAQAA